LQEVQDEKPPRGRVLQEVQLPELTAEAREKEGSERQVIFLLFSSFFNFLSVAYTI